MRLSRTANKAVNTNGLPIAGKVLRKPLSTAFVKRRDWGKQDVGSAAAEVNDGTEIMAALP